MPTPEVVFTVHPRPTSDDPGTEIGLDSLTEQGRSLLLIESLNCVEDVGETKQGIFDDIVFLMRYMMERY